ncbi:MAG TPA: lytic transglycosylase domain-containing protein [Thermoanaerobaculia bacterium]|nr:lytic transglycosylase domain-containing protein [Thermoanaerobaculia bacterium]
MSRALILLLALAVPAASAAGELKATRRADGTLVLTNDASTGPAASRPPRRRQPAAELAPVIDRYAQDRRLDPQLVRAVIQTESAYDVRAVSSKGAIGLMQLLPTTAAELGVDPWDPEQNVRGGTLYLRRLIDHFQGDVELALAGYNAGPGAVQRYGGVPPYRETTSYVERVLSLYHDRPWKASPARAEGRARAGSPGLSSVRVHRDEAGRLVFTTPR